MIRPGLVAGIAGAGHVKVVGRMGLRAIIYFEIVTTIALGIGLAAVNIMKPGVGVNLPMGQQSEISAKPQTWDQILLHVVPESVIDAMAPLLKPDQLDRVCRIASRA